MYIYLYMFGVQVARCMVKGVGCRVQGCRVWGVTCRVQSAGCRVQGSGWEIATVEFTVDFATCTRRSPVPRLCQRAPSTVSVHFGSQVWKARARFRSKVDGLVLLKVAGCVLYCEPRTTTGDK